MSDLKLLLIGFGLLLLTLVWPYVEPLIEMLKSS